MPELWVLRYYKPALTVRQIGPLKDKFDVSWEAITIRIDELGLCEKPAIYKLFNAWKKADSVVYLANREARAQKLTEPAAGPVAVPEVNNCTSRKIRREWKMSRFLKIPDNDEKMRFVECPACAGWPNRRIMDTFDHKARTIYTRRRLFFRSSGLPPSKLF